MSRPRIRTLKPELWQDEKIGGLSRDARLLFVGLVTMADDEGRLRALPALILGHVFPYDTDALRKLEQWLGEIAGSGLISRYVAGGTPYVQIMGWGKHQVINRPTPSDLPPGPFTEPSVRDHGAHTERSSSSRAPADRIGSDQEGKAPQPPASGGRKRAVSSFEDSAVAWATKQGVTGDRALVLQAYRQCCPWLPASRDFRSFCGHYFPRLTVKEEHVSNVHPLPERTA